MSDVKRVLLAEDDRFLRKAAEATLRNGEEVLQRALETPPDLILLDLIMPKLHGFDVLRTLKADPRTSEIPVIVLSNLGQGGDVETAGWPRPTTRSSCATSSGRLG